MGPTEAPCIGSMSLGLTRDVDRSSHESHSPRSMWWKLKQERELDILGVGGLEIGLSNRFSNFCSGGLCWMVVASSDVRWKDSFQA